MSSADSPGHLITETEPVLIFDLDGTIISLNSFHIWLIYLLMGRFPGLSWPERLRLSGDTIKALAIRKLGRRSHFATKQHLQALWIEAVKNDQQQEALLTLCAVMGENIRPNMKGALALIVQGKENTILATAAAGSYADAFGHSLGFSHVFSTRPSGSENCGMEKRDRVLSFLKERGLNARRRIFLTDHEDDLPLIRESQLVLWFGMDWDIERVRAAAPGIELISCRKMKGAEIVRILFPV